MPYCYGHHCGPIEDLAAFSVPETKVPCIATRSWCLQERLLSRRIVFFGSHEVAWECMMETACYCQDSFQTWQRVTERDQHAEAVARLAPGLSQVYLEVG